MDEIYYIVYFPDGKDGHHRIIRHLFGIGHQYPGIYHTWNQDEKIILGRDGGPCLISNDGIEMWIKDGNLHREDGPAVIYENGDETWYMSGKMIETPL